MTYQRPFHLVDNSQLSILIAASARLLAMLVVFYSHPTDDSTLAKECLPVAVILFPFILLSWVISVVKQSMSYHNKMAQRGFRLGMILSIISKIFFFFAFFWAFFHF